MCTRAGACRTGRYARGAGGIEGIEGIEGMEGMEGIEVIGGIGGMLRGLAWVSFVWVRASRGKIFSPPQPLLGKEGQRKWRMTESGTPSLCPLPVGEEFWMALRAGCWVHLPYSSLARRGRARRSKEKESGEIASSRSRQKRGTPSGVRRGKKIQPFLTCDHLVT